MTNFYGIFKCCWLKNTFKHTAWYALAIWLGTMNVANAGTGDETLPMSLDEAFNSGGVYILSNDIVIKSKIVVSSNNGIEIQLNDYNISAADAAAIIRRTGIDYFGFYVSACRAFHTIALLRSIVCSLTYKI